MRRNDLERGRPAYYNGRAEYMRVAQDFALSLDPESALEIGPGPDGMPILEGAATMDIVGGPTYLHDATVKPWPLADQSVDVVIALQVWEHLRGYQRAAWSEVKRVARRGAVLSFPYLWWGGDDDHNEIGWPQINRWTQPPHRARLVDPRGWPRQVCLYRFTP